MPYDEAKVAELQARVEAREKHIRESWIRTMEARLVRQELDKCVAHEGVNHYENCRDLSQRYISMLRENRVKGYKDIDI